jgi:hypothetical protein
VTGAIRAIFVRGPEESGSNIPTSHNPENPTLEVHFLLSMCLYYVLHAFVIL